MKGVYKASIAIIAVALMVAVPFAAAVDDGSDGAQIVTGQGTVSFKSSNALDTATIKDIYTQEFLDKIFKSVCQGVGLNYVGLTSIGVTFDQMNVQTAITASIGNNQTFVQKAESYTMKITIQGSTPEDMSLFEPGKCFGIGDYESYWGKTQNGDDLKVVISCSVKMLRNNTMTATPNSKSNLVPTFVDDYVKGQVNIDSADVTLTPKAAGSSAKNLTVKGDLLNETRITESKDYGKNYSDVLTDSPAKSNRTVSQNNKFTGTYKIGDKTYSYFTENPEALNSSVATYTSVVTSNLVTSDITISTLDLVYWGKTSSSSDNINVLMPYVNTAYQDNAALKTKLSSIGTCSEDYGTGCSIVNSVSSSIPSIYGSSESSEGVYIAWVIGFLAILLLLCLGIGLLSKGE